MRPTIRAGCCCRCADIADGARVRGCSLELHAGEVLGIAGLVGAGRTELARLIFGAEARTRGSIEIEGRALAMRTPREAIEAGLVYLTEDRKRQGLFLDMSVLGNINIAVCGRDARAGGCARPRARRAARQAGDRLAVDPRAERAHPRGRRCRAATSRRCCSRACWRRSRAS